MSFGSVLASPCHDYFFHSTSNESAAAIYNCTGDYYAASAGYAPSPTTLDHYPNVKQVSLRAGDGELTNWSCNYDTGYSQPFEPSLYQPLKAPNKGRLNSVQGAGMMFCGKPRVVKRRVSANKKERRRTLSINSAFSNLRERIPFIPPDTKLSKIKTLRLATSYIAYLIDFLDANENQKDIPNDGFKNVVTKTLETRERRKRELLKAAIQTERNIKPLCKDFNPMRNVNRTGWPQHVWASELGQNIHAHTTTGCASPNFMDLPVQNQN